MYMFNLFIVYYPVCCSFNPMVVPTPSNMVDAGYKTWIFIQCSLLIATLCGYMNLHCE